MHEKDENVFTLEELFFFTTHPHVQMLSWDNSCIMQMDMKTCFHRINKQSQEQGLNDNIILFFILM